MWGTGTGLTQGDERRDVSFLAADTWRPGKRSARAKNYRGGFECWRRDGVNGLVVQNHESEGQASQGEQRTGGAEPAAS